MKNIFTTENIHFLSSWAGLDKEITDEIVKFSQKNSGNDEFIRGFEQVHQRLYFNENYSIKKDDEFSAIQTRLQGDAGKYNLLMALSGIPDALEIHRQKNIPENITRDTLGDISLRAEFCRGKNTIDMPAETLGWCKGYLTGKLFRLGRLQFKPCQFYDVHVFRNRASGKVIALMQGNTTFNSKGLYDGTNGVFDENAWTSTLEMNDQEAIGFPIEPNGYTSKRLVSLSLDEWEKILAPGDPMLDIHIPAGGSMSHENCRASISKADVFFSEYFPDLPFKGFVCRSWFLDPQLSNILPDSSNIVKFQQSCYLFPTIGGDASAITRVFGEEYINMPIAKFPQDTSLRRAIADFMEKGGRPGMGAGFFLREDLPWHINAYYHPQKKLNNR